MRAVAALTLPLLTSRRHIDLLRVCSAADPLHRGGPAPARR
ncbi:putative leader peptide [Streptomyces yangpuensis]